MLFLFLFLFLFCFVLFDETKHHQRRERQRETKGPRERDGMFTHGRDVFTELIEQNVFTELIEQKQPYRDFVVWNVVYTLKPRFRSGRPG